MGGGPGPERPTASPRLPARPLGKPPSLAPLPGHRCHGGESAQEKRERPPATRRAAAGGWEGGTLCGSAAAPRPAAPRGRGGLHQYFTREADGLPAPRVAQELGPGAGGQLPDRPCHASSCPESHHPKPLAGLEAAPGAPPPFLARAWGALSPPGHRSGLPSRASPAPAACRALPRVGVSCTPSAHAPRHAGARTQAQRRKRAVACACTRRASPGDSPKRRHRSQGGGGGLSRGGGG